MGEMIMRPCGGSWAYCDGMCHVCEKANITTSNSTAAAKTNADHIRSMTDEELAEFFCCRIPTCPPDVEEDRVCYVDADCKRCWRGWLILPYKEDA